MKKILILFLLLNLSILCNSQTLKILWWNTENFFDTEDDLKKNDYIVSVEDYNYKLKMVSIVLNKIDADIVGLAEIENIYILKQLADLTKYPYYYLKEGNDPRGIDICVLSKYKMKYISHINQLTPYKGNKNYKFSRDCPEAMFEINNKKIYLLLNHLKSKIGDPKKSELKRTAQTNGIIKIINKINKTNQNEPLILIFGDFNSNRYSKPLDILEKNGLEIINYHFNENKIYTTLYNNKKHDYDYFIMNKMFYKNSIIKIFKSFNSKEFQDISDHFPLYLEIELK